MASIALGLLGSAPAIIQGIASLVHGIEGIFGKGKGGSKKAAVTQAFNGAVEAYNATAGDIPGGKLPQFGGGSEAAFSALVDAIVAFYNSTGVFTHSATS